MMTTQERLFSEVRGPITSYIKRRFSTRPDKDDLAQEALIAVWKALEKYDPLHPRANLRLWAKKAARFAALSAIVKQTWVSGYELKKLDWIRKLQELIEWLEHNPGDEKLLRLLEAHLTKRGVNMPLEEVILALEEEDPIKKLAGFSQEEWGNIYSFLQQGHMDDLYRTMDVEDEDVILMDTIEAPRPRDTRLREALKEAITELSPEKQFILCLYDLLGLTMEEVAHCDARGRTVQALYSARNIALSELKEVLLRNAEARNREDGRGEHSRPTTVQQVLSAILRK